MLKIDKGVPYPDVRAFSATLDRSVAEAMEVSDSVECPTKVGARRFAYAANNTWKSDLWPNEKRVFIAHERRVWRVY